MHPLAFSGSVSPVSAEMLQAAIAGIAGHSASGPDMHATSNDASMQVSHVLSDALAGGSDSKPDIDVLLQSAGKGGAAHDAIAHALAMVGSHEGFAVPGAHGMPIAEALVMHAPAPHG
jgi:hypothetical protein